VVDASGWREDWVDERMRKFTHATVRQNHQHQVKWVVGDIDRNKKWTFSTTSRG
jgi:hypothetical protein